MTDALGGQTAYEYDSQGNVTKVTDANGNATRYTYDPSGRLTTETDALGNTLRYSYTPEGWLDTVTNPDGTIIRYAYDRTGNLISEDRGGTEKVQHSYNLLGQLTTVTNAQGSTRYQYNDRGWLIFVIAPDGSRVEYQYDDLGHQNKIIYPDGKSVSYAYDDMDRLVSVKGLDGSTTEYAYDANGRRIATKGAQAETAYSYNPLGQLVNQTTTGSANLAFAYRYDAAGRIIGETRTENGTATESAYAYDPLGQLTAFTRSTGYAERYAYDLAGNMTEKLVNGQKVTMTYNPANQLTEMSSDKGSIRYAYDPNGNLTQKQSALGADTYTYDALGRLTGYTGYDSYSQSYQYNAFDLLSEKTSSGNANRLTQEEYVSGRTLENRIEQFQSETTRYTWDVTRSFGVLLSEATGNITTDYDYGFERISSLTGTTKTEYLYDPRGSVAAELRYDTAQTADSIRSQIEVSTRVYNPFGEQLGSKQSGFGYNGESYDAATGALYLRARYYEPALNRFSQKDSQFFVVNEYEFCFNNPVAFIDPNGREAIVISGGDYNNKGEENGQEKLNSYNFILTSLRDVTLLRKKGIDDHITWIIADAGWSDSDKTMFQTAAEKVQVEIIYISNASQITSYINTQDIASSGSSVSESRKQDSITYLSVFSHGLSNGTIALAYDYTSEGELRKEFEISSAQISNWDKAAFARRKPGVDTPTVKLFSCNAATAGKNSLAYKLAVGARVTVYAYSRKSTYECIIAERSWWTKMLDKVLGRTNPVTDKYWSDLENGILNPSYNQPKAGNGASAVKINPNGTKKNPNFIPDLNKASVPLKNNVPKRSTGKVFERCFGA